MRKYLYLTTIILALTAVSFLVHHNEVLADSYQAPYVNLSSPTLSSDHNTLTFTTSAQSGHFIEQCGELFQDPDYVGGPRIDMPYLMSGGSYSASSVSGGISSGEITQTSAGSEGTECNDPIRSNETGPGAELGEAGSYSLTKSINVSSLSNGTYTLNVTLCAVSGVCATDSANFTIDRATETTLSGSCSGSPLFPDVGTEVTWSASASGGTGSYSYSWSGAVSGSGQTVTNTYSTVGTKTANVTISSGSQSVTKSCSVEVRSPEEDVCQIEVSSNLGTTWLIGNPTGTWGKSDNYPIPVTYSLTFTNDNGDPFDVAGTYSIQAQDLSGYTKEITPSSSQFCDPSGGTQTKSFQITYTEVPEDPEDPPPGPGAPECSPTSQSAYTGSTVGFSATGGDGSFSWSAPGSSNTSGTGDEFSTSYSTTGGKTVTVTSAGLSDTCSVSVSEPPSEFYCTPKNQTVEVGEAAYVSGCGSPNSQNVRLFAPNGDPRRTEGGYLTQCWGSNITFSSVSAQENVYAYRGSYNSDTCYVEVTEAAPYNDASCVDITAPSQVIAGEDFQASVTMQNSGTKDWNKDSTPHRLASANPFGNTKWGFSIVTLPTEPVTSGEQVTFNFTATAPSTTGSQSFDWRMNESTFGSFGTACTATIDVIAGAEVIVESNVATTWALSGPDGTNTQVNPAINITYDPVEPGTYTISNIPDKSGYESPTVSPGNSQSVPDGGTRTFTIDYVCLDADNDGICDSVSGPPGGGGGDPGDGPDNCPEVNNPGQEDADGDGIGDACDDTPGGEPNPSADYSLSSTNNITVDKTAGETQSTQTTINVTPYNGYDGNVNLSVIRGPAVEEYVFGDDVLSSSEYSTGSSFYVVIPSDFPRGSYPIDIQGESNDLVRNVTVILSVDESGPRFEEF